MARQGASVSTVSLGACVACFDSTTDTGHVPPDFCFMVSPSCIIVVVICSVLTHRICSWPVSILRFFFPVVCAQLMERLLNLVIVPTCRSELTVSHSASALAQEAATRVPKWKDLGPLRLPSPWTDEPMATCAVWGVWRGTNVTTIPAGGSFEC